MLVAPFVPFLFDCYHGARFVVTDIALEKLRRQFFRPSDLFPQPGQLLRPAVLVNAAAPALAELVAHAVETVAELGLSAKQVVVVCKVFGLLFVFIVLANLSYLYFLGHSALLLSVLIVSASIISFDCRSCEWLILQVFDL